MNVRRRGEGGHQRYDGKEERQSRHATGRDERGDVITTSTKPPSPLIPPGLMIGSARSVTRTPRARRKKAAARWEWARRRREVARKVEGEEEGGRRMVSLGGAGGQGRVG